MCGRFSLFAPKPDLENRFDISIEYQFEPRYNIAPQDDLDVVPNDDPEHARQMNWGIRPHWVDDPRAWSHPINARAETVASKPSFRSAFEKRRCLVLADGFYEWKGSRGNKQPYRIERADDGPFAFAGLWETWGGNGDGDELETVTIITTKPNDLMEPIHDRMPVILDKPDERRWLEEDDTDELQSMLDPYPDGQLDAYEIATKVNDPDNDSPDIIEPLGHDQSGLGQFS